MLPDLCPLVLDPVLVVDRHLLVENTRFLHLLAKLTRIEQATTQRRPHKPSKPFAGILSVRHGIAFDHLVDNIRDDRHVPFLVDPLLLRALDNLCFDHIDRRQLRRLLYR